MPMARFMFKRQTPRTGSRNERVRNAFIAQTRASGAFALFLKTREARVKTYLAQNPLVAAHPDRQDFIDAAVMAGAI